MQALLLFLLFVVVQLIAELATPHIPAASRSEAMGLSLLIMQSLLSLGLWGWFSLQRRRRPIVQASSSAPLPTTKRTLRQALVAVLLLAFGLSLLLQPLGLPDDGSTALFDGMKRNPLCILLLTVVGPLTEELVFRAGLIPSFRRNRLPGWAAAGLSAFTFALVHGNVAQGIPAFLIGWVLGLLYLRTGDLRLCLPAHIANNVFAVVLLYLDDPLADFSVAMSLGLGVLHFGLGLLNLWRVMRRPGEASAPSPDSL